jgi:hypothetical protein
MRDWSHAGRYLAIHRVPHAPDSRIRRFPPTHDREAMMPRRRRWDESVYWRDQRGIASDLSLSVRQVAYLVKEGMPTQMKDGKRRYYVPACCQWYMLHSLRERWHRKGYSEPQIQAMLDADPQLRGYQRWERRDSCAPEAIRAYEDHMEALERASQALCAHCGEPVEA